jgi:hypothetical protein
MRFDSVKKWLEKCISGHRNCASVFICDYPSRLLQPDCDKWSTQVRLVDTQAWPEPRPDYVALSRYWGPPDGPRPLKTTSQNVDEHKIGITLEDLPRTLREADLISKRLGQTFIWIDSLCIIQDDTRDWESEAANMAAIYQGAFLTISAATSKNCEGDCDLEP